MLAMDFGALEIIIGTAALLFSLYYYLSTNFDYWRKQNVAGPKPIPLFGNYKDVICGFKTEAEVVKTIYDNYKDERLIGVYIRSDPRLIIRDPDLIKDVLIKDFDVFPNRGLHIYEKTNPFSANLLNLEYKRWKPLRNSLSSLFTPGKIKVMFYLMIECAENLQKYTEQIVEKGLYIDAKELAAKFTTDTLGSCAFGLNMNALNDEQSAFRKFGRSIFDVSFRNQLKGTLRMFFPTIYRLIGHFLEAHSDNSFFIDSIKQTMTYRKENNIRRNDFLDLLMDLKENPNTSCDVEFTDNLLIAQSYIFFAAGFETSAGTISNTLYELALNPLIQDKLRKEILEQVAQNNGKLTYECLMNMTYLDKVIKESLRKYSVVAVLHREAVTSYTFKGTEVTIPKHTKVIIPIWAIHQDPDIYPDPKTYDPERFNNENEKTRHPMNYLPLSDGPRNCIGLRFAKFQTKIGVAAIVEKFQIDVCDKTCMDYRLDPKAPLATPIGGLYLKLSKI